MWSIDSRSGTTDLPVEIKSRISSKTYHTTTSATLLSYTESNFGEIECGEPQTAQHLFFDFTPNTELDTPEVRDKVSSFFEFINSQAQLAQFCQMPEPVAAQSKSKPAKKKKVRTKDAFESVDFMEKPTVSDAQKMLETHRTCVSNLNNDDMIVKRYHLEGDDTISDISEPKDAHAKKVVSKHSRLKNQKRLSSLCKTLDDWDKKHLKSMDPPGPLLKNFPILQRRKPLDNAYR